MTVHWPPAAREALQLLVWVKWLLTETVPSATGTGPLLVTRIGCIMPVAPTTSVPKLSVAGASPSVLAERATSA